MKFIFISALETLQKMPEITLDRKTLRELARLFEHQELSAFLLL